MKEGTIQSGVLWMSLLSILLFWLPFLGPLVAGIIGGKKAGSLGNAVAAAFLPGTFVRPLLSVVPPCILAAFIRIPGSGFGWIMPRQVADDVWL
jgi:hypothetical protein